MAGFEDLLVGPSFDEYQLWLGLETLSSWLGFGKYQLWLDLENFLVWPSYDWFWRPSQHGQALANTNDGWVLKIVPVISQCTVHLICTIF